MMPVALRTSVFIVAGVLLGLLHFAALHRAVRVHLQRRDPRFGVHSARFASTIAGLFLVTRAGGTMGLLASFVGFLAARALATLPRRPA